MNNKDSVKYEIALPQIHHQPVATDATFKNATSASAAAAASTNIVNNSPPPPPPRAVKKMTHLNDGGGGDNNVNVGNVGNVGNVVKPTVAGMSSNQFASLQRFSSQGLPGGHHHHHHHHYYAYHPVNTFNSGLRLQTTFKQVYQGALEGFELGPLKPSW